MPEEKQTEKAAPVSTRTGPIYTVAGFLSVLLPPRSNLSYRRAEDPQWFDAVAGPQSHRFTAHGGESLQANGGPEVQVLADLAAKKLIVEASAK